MNGYGFPICAYRIYRINNKIFKLYGESGSKPIKVEVLCELKERLEDECFCVINQDKSIQYWGNESWQCSKIIYNPKFPQKENCGIELQSKDYDIALKLLLYGEFEPFMK